MKMLNTAVRGEMRSMKIIPRENIWTPDPEKYNMTACMGSDFAGLLFKSGPFARE